MDRKIAEAGRAKPPLESILKLALKLNSGERLLAAKDAANLPRLSTSWLARVPGRRLRTLWQGQRRCQPFPAIHWLGECT
jgi:hypothetical protein